MYRRKRTCVSMDALCHLSNANITKTQHDTSKRQNSQQEKNNNRQQHFITYIQQILGYKTAAVIIYYVSYTNKWHGWKWKITKQKMYSTGFYFSSIFNKIGKGMLLPQKHRKIELEKRCNTKYIPMFISQSKMYITLKQGFWKCLPMNSIRS